MSPELYDSPTLCEIRKNEPWQVRSGLSFFWRRQKVQSILYSYHIIFLLHFSQLNLTWFEHRDYNHRIIEEFDLYVEYNLSSSKECKDDSPCDSPCTVGILRTIEL